MSKTPEKNKFFHGVPTFMLGSVFGLACAFVIMFVYKVSDTVSIQFDPLQAIITLALAIYVSIRFERGIANERGEKELCLRWLEELRIDLKRFGRELEVSTPYLTIVNRIKALRSRSYKITRKITELYTESDVADLDQLWWKLLNLLTSSHPNGVKIKNNQVDISLVIHEVDDIVTDIELKLFDLARTVNDGDLK